MLCLDCWCHPTKQTIPLLQYAYTLQWMHACTMSRSAYSKMCMISALTYLIPHMDVADWQLQVANNCVNQSLEHPSSPSLLTIRLLLRYKSSRSFRLICVSHVVHAWSWNLERMSVHAALADNSLAGRWALHDQHASSWPLSPTLQPGDSQAVTICNCASHTEHVIQICHANDNVTMYTWWEVLGWEGRYTTSYCSFSPVETSDLGPARIYRRSMETNTGDLPRFAQGTCITMPCWSHYSH